MAAPTELLAIIQLHVHVCTCTEDKGPTCTHVHRKGYCNVTRREVARRMKRKGNENKEVTREVHTVMKAPKVLMLWCMYMYVYNTGWLLLYTNLE